jgi:hypothetical protein
MGIPDGNLTQTEIILDRAWDTWQAKQGRKLGSVPAWLGMVMSILLVAYVAGQLTGDIAEANTRSIENRQKIEALERQNSSIEQGIASLNAKMDILMEERKR